jgi:TrmH family RNA methyltransferase
MRKGFFMTNIPVIQSIGNSMVKHAYSLKVPKKLKESEDFLCEGFHLVKEALRSDLKIRYLFATAKGYTSPEGQEILLQADRLKVRCFEIPNKTVTYLADTVTPQGILAVVAKPPKADLQPPFGLFLAAYQIQDAGNLGTLFRSAEAFGAQGLFLTEGCCDPFNPKVVRASMGSLFRVPFDSNKPWEEHLAWCKGNGFTSLALTGKSEKTLFEYEPKMPLVLWVGSEGGGLPEELIKACDQSCKIPMMGQVESLNVAVAASIALFYTRKGGPFLDTPESR